MTHGNWPPAPSGQPSWGSGGSNPGWQGYRQQPTNQWQAGYSFQTPGFRPPPQPPRRRRGGGIVALIVVIVALVVAVGIIRALSSAIEDVVAGNASTPTTRSTTASPSATPTALPTTENQPNTGLPPRTWEDLPPATSTNPDWVTLQQNELYTLAVPTLVNCPAPELATSMADVERLTLGQMACIQDAFRPLQASLGFSTDELPIYFYDGSTVSTPCGEVSAPALYCSAQGGAIYFGTDVLNGASWMDFGIKDVAGHEFGHHLQAQAGMFQAEYAVGADNETARRIELQASCWGYAMLSHDTSMTFTAQTMNDIDTYLRAVIEDGIHGSKESLAYWGTRGLYSTTMGNCNTWTVPASAVD